MQERRTQDPCEKSTEVDMLRLLSVLGKWIWLIVIVALLCGVVTYICSEAFVAPAYRSGFTAYVNNRQNTSEEQSSISNSDLSTSKNLTYLYQEIITSRSVLMDAAESCGLNYSYSTLYSMVGTSVADSAAIITVYVEAEDPAEATMLAQAITEVAPIHVERVVEGSSMRIVDMPIQPTDPFSPDSGRNAWLAALLGLVISAVILIVLDMVTDKVQSGKEMEERYGLVVIGNIPDLAVSEKRYEAYTPGKSGRDRR